MFESASGVILTVLSVLIDSREESRRRKKPKGDKMTQVGYWFLGAGHVGFMPLLFVVYLRASVSTNIIS